jgi:hypothetical protein
LTTSSITVKCSSVMGLPLRRNLILCEYTFQQCSGTLTILLLFNRSVSLSPTNAQGSILILPDGATREDLRSTRRFHSYIRKWAPYWYQDLDISNGSLFLVTGCDKTSDWAVATFPDYPRDGRSELHYTWRPGNESGWDTRENVVSDRYIIARAKVFGQDEGARNQCVFLRSMRISLGEALWSSAVPSNGRLAGSHAMVTYKVPALTHFAGVAVRKIQELLSSASVDVSERLRACHKVGTSSTRQISH